MPTMGNNPGDALTSISAVGLRRGLTGLRAELFMKLLLKEPENFQGAEGP